MSITSDESQVLEHFGKIGYWDMEYNHLYPRVKRIQEKWAKRKIVVSTWKPLNVILRNDPSTSAPICKMQQNNYSVVWWAQEEEIEKEEENKFDWRRIQTWLVIYSLKK